MDKEGVAGTSGRANLRGRGNRLLGSESRLAVSDERDKKDYISTWIERKRAEKYKIN